MKMKLFLVAVVLFGSVFNIHSQQLTVKGGVIDSTHQPLAGTNVILYSRMDTTKYVDATITDKEGNFIFHNVKKGKYIISISYLGYDKKPLSFEISDQVLDLGKIQLAAHSSSLDEVVVTADMIRSMGDKQVFLFSPTERKVAKTGFDLLQNIPQLSINPINNTLSKTSGGSVKMLLNGRNVTEMELSTLKPDEILKIEYYANPPARYASLGVAAVINITTKRPTSNGGLFSVNLKNSFTTGYGTNIVSFRYHTPTNEYALTYFIDYRDLHKNTLDQSWNYKLNNGLYEKTRIGDFGIYSGQYHIVQGNFSRTIENKYYLNITPSLRFNSGVENYPQSVFSKTPGSTLQMGNAENNTKSDYFSPSIDIYFSKELGGNKELIFNTVNTYYKSSSDKLLTENYNLYTSNESTTFNNKSFSNISEVSFNTKIKEQNFSTGVRYFYKSLNEKYSNNEADNNSDKYNLQNIYGYASISGKYKKWSYTLGVGAQNSWINNSDPKSYFVFKPNLTLSNSLSDKSTITFSSNVKSFVPDISMLSNNPVYIDSSFISKGNPNLRPYYSFNNELDYSFNTKPLYFEVSLSHKYAKNPYYTVFKNNGVEAIKTTENEDYLQQSSLEIYTKWNIAKWLSFRPAYSISRNESKGSGLQLKKWTQQLVLTSVSSYKDFSLLLQYQPLSNTFEGETMSTRATLYYGSLGWEKNNWNLSLGYINMIYDGSDNFSTCDGVPVAMTQNKIWYNFRNLVFVKCVYTLPFGNKKQSKGSQKINNTDDDTGLFKDSRAKG